jgi:hypothetical protein
MGNLLVRAMNASLNIGAMFERCGWYNEISLEAETESFEPSFVARTQSSYAISKSSGTMRFWTPVGS